MNTEEEKNELSDAPVTSMSLEGSVDKETLDVLAEGRAQLPSHMAEDVADAPADLEVSEDVKEVKVLSTTEHLMAFLNEQYPNSQLALSPADHYSIRQLLQFVCSTPRVWTMKQRGIFQKQMLSIFQSTFNNWLVSDSEHAHPALCDPETFEGPMSLHRDYVAYVMVMDPNDPKVGHGNVVFTVHPVLSNGDISNLLNETGKSSADLALDIKKRYGIPFVPRPEDRAVILHLRATQTELLTQALQVTIIKDQNKANGLIVDNIPIVALNQGITARTRQGLANAALNYKANVAAIRPKMPMQVAVGAAMAVQGG